MGPISSKVFFVDFGNEAVIENEHIRALKAQFREIPPKAMMCALDKVAPLDGQKEWSEECIVKMKQMVSTPNLLIVALKSLKGKKT